MQGARTETASAIPAAFCGDSERILNYLIFLTVEAASLLSAKSFNLEE
jgi:hypothetical protein